MGIMKIIWFYVMGRILAIVKVQTYKHYWCDLANTISDIGKITY
jgi:hypothetical protein